MLDPSGKDVSFHRAELVRDAVDHERLHSAQHQPELLVHVAVERDGRAWLELDHVEHRSLAEQRAAGDAVGELERTYLVEADETGSTGMTLLRLRVGKFRARLDR